ncbi:MAG: DUF1631 domain-containing protein [Gammaproteobacteria bacterium]|nr:DUF1631 domain-containing protein [Gammaproteobacteria bacterium]
MGTQAKIVSLNAQGNRLDQQVKHQKLLEACKSHSLKYVRSLMQVMFDSADDALFEMAEKSDNNTDQSVYFDSMRIVRLKRKEIETQYYKNIENLFSHKNKTPASSTQNDDSEQNDLSFENLSLMEEMDLEESLAIGNLADKIRSNFGADINAIEQRLKLIAPELTETDANPFDPANLSKAFQDATDPLDTELKIKLIIYKLFDKQLSASIGQLYQNVNAHFIEAGVLPKIKHQRPQQSASNSGRPISNASSAEIEEPTGIPYYDTQSSRTYQGDAGNGEVLVPLQQVLAQMQTGGMHPSTMSTGTGAGMMGKIPVSSSAQVIGALSEIQNTAIPFSSDTNPQEISSQIKTMLVNQVNQSVGQPTAIDSVDNGIIDVVSMLFEFILDDANLPVAARAAIARLQIPLLKIAVSDKEFFNTKAHPARVLLNTLAKAALGLDESATSDNSPILEKIESTVEAISLKYTSDINIFEELLNEFITFAEEQEEGTEDTEQSAIAPFQKKEEQALAKAWVQETLNDAVTDKNIPEQVVKFLNGPWADVMLHTYLEQGKDSHLWKNQLRFIDVLVWSAEPKHLSLDKKKLGNIVQHLVGTLKEGLENINYPSDKTEKVLQAMEACHHASIHGLFYAQESINATSETSEQYDNEQQEASGSFFLFDNAVPDEVEITTTVADETDTTALEDDITDSAIDHMITGLEDQVASLSELESLLEEAITDTEEIDDDRIVMEDIVLSSWEENEQPEDYPDDEYLDIARHLESGKWLEFVDDKGQKQRAKLAWKSDLLGEYTFLNWKFDVVADKTLYGLANDLRSGRANIVDEVPILDRALTAVLSGFKKSA